MNDQPDPMDPFETSIRRLMVIASQRVLRPFDPLAITDAAAAAASPARSRVRSIGRREFRGMLLVATAAIVAAAVVGGLAAGGAHLPSEVPTSAPSLPALTNPSMEPPRSTPAPTPVASPIDRCAALSSIAKHTGAVTGGWTPGPEPNAASKVANGLIAAVPFALNSDKQGDNDIHLFDPVAGTQTKVTDFGPSDVNTDSIAWSRTGTNLAYLTSHDTPDGNGCADLFVWSRNQLVRTLGAHVYPMTLAWAPDESAIAVINQTMENASVWVVPADGSAVQNLGMICPTYCYDFAGPTWSPDGDRIAISGSNDQGETVASGVVNVRDGSWTTLPAGSRVTRWLDAETLLVDPAGDGELATVNLGGGTAPEGSAAPLRAVSAAWPPATMYASPDLDFAMDWEPCGSNQGACRVVVRDRATGKDHVVFNRKGANVGAFWAPDSRSILVNVVEGAPGDVGIWTVRVDGSGARRVYDVPVTRGYPIDWQPIWP